MSATKWLCPTCGCVNEDDDWLVEYPICVQCNLQTDWHEIEIGGYIEDEEESEG